MGKNVRDRLFLRPAEADFTAGVERGLKPHVLVPPIALLPYFRILQRGHHDLLGAELVELGADNIVDVVEHAQAKRQVGVHPRHLFVDKTGADQELSVFCHFIRGKFFAGLGE